MRHTLFATLFVLAFSVPALAQKSGRDRVLKIDAVALLDAGKELEGKVDLQHQHGRYNYLFANAANLATFKGNPAKYEIQQNGACGRMGPLSGEGSPKIFAVHEGRLYIFASEQCKRTFVAGAGKFIDRDDAAPATTPESISRGWELLERAVKGIGGAARLDAIVSYRERLSREVESGGKNYVVTDTLTLLLPEGVCSVNCWNDQCWGNVATSSDAWSTDADGAESLVESQRSALLRSSGRHPLTLLRQRERAGLIVTSAGEKRAIEVAGDGPIELELLDVHADGATTTLGLDADGRIRLLAYRGRGPSLAIGRVERMYSAFHDVGGLSLAGRVDVTFEGKPSPDESGAFVEQTIDSDSHRDLFVRKP